MNDITYPRYLIFIIKEEIEILDPVNLTQIVTFPVK